MTDTTWTNGGGDGKASTAANWSNGIDVGYNVIFDETSTDNCTFDYAEQLGTLTVAAAYSGIITQSSDMHISGYSQDGGTFTGVTSKMIRCSGNFTKTAGTFTAYVANLNMTGTGKTINFNPGCYGLYIYGNTSLISTVTVNTYFVNAATITVPSNKYLIIYNTAITNYVNNGIIEGTGTCSFWAIADNYNLPLLGDIQCPVSIYSDTEIQRTVTLQHDTVMYNSLSVFNAHAIQTLILNLNGHSLTATTITVGTRGILSNSGTDSVISCANFDSSAGTFTEANTQVIMSGNGTLKTAAGHKFDELVQRDNIVTTLASDITVTNEFDTAGSFILGTYAITHENPEKRLKAPMVNPIIRNPKRSPFLNNRFTRNIELEVV